MLVDSEQIANNVLADTLTRYGHQISGAESERRFRGMKLAECLAILQRESGIELPDTFEFELRQRMSASFKTHLAPVAGAQRLLESMRVPFCVASSGPRAKIEENLQTTNLYSHFVNRIFSAYEVQSWKPDPGLFLAAADHFSVKPRECIVIEDSHVGVSAGVAANMTVYALSPAANDQSVAAADRVFASLTEIQAFFATLGLARL